jgi:hypothetical protein
MTMRRDASERSTPDAEREPVPEEPREGVPAPAAGGDRLLRDARARRGARPLLARRVRDLQRRLGNQHVIRMLHSSEGWSAGAAERAEPAASSGAPPIQRYAVSAPASARSEQLVRWLNANSPHKPAWARTDANFSWGRTMNAVPGEDEGTWIVTVADPTVTKNTTVDMPTWTADNEPMQTVWDEMWAELRAHEAEHEAIADGWQTTMQENLEAAEYVVTASSEAEAKRLGRAEADGEWTGWIDAHQAEQRALDTPPFFATLNYPAEEEEASPETAESSSSPTFEER